MRAGAAFVAFALSGLGGCGQSADPPRVIATENAEKARAEQWLGERIGSIARSGEGVRIGAISLPTR